MKTIGPTGRGGSSPAADHVRTRLLRSLCLSSVLSHTVWMLKIIYLGNQTIRSSNTLSEVLQSFFSSFIRISPALQISAGRSYPSDTCGGKLFNYIWLIISLLAICFCSFIIIFCSRSVLVSIIIITAHTVRDTTIPRIYMEHIVWVNSFTGVWMSDCLHDGCVAMLPKEMFS